MRESVENICNRVTGLNFNQMWIKKTREKVYENRLRNRVRKMGGIALKWVSPGFAGVPDRIILIAGRVYFVEVKAEGEKPSPQQSFVHRTLLKLGFIVYVIDSNETLDNLLNKIAREIESA